MLARIIGVSSGLLLKVGLMEFAVGINVYTKDLFPPKDFGL